MTHPRPEYGGGVNQLVTDITEYQGRPEGKLGEGCNKLNSGKLIILLDLKACLVLWSKEWKK